MISSRAAALVLALVVAALPATGQGVVPLGDEQVVPVAFGWAQEWAKVGLEPDGSRFAVTYETVIGHDVLVRFYDGAGVPTSGEIQVNATLTNHIQDEPMAAMDAGGRLLVCWSDRSNYDGGTSGGPMGCFGQLFTPAGTPFGTEFQINEQGDESQWEPMPSALPAGGWVVAFNGDDDGNAYLRFFDVDGTPRTGDIAVNTFWNNGQTEAECAVSPLGVLLAVYADFGGNVQAGTGTNLLARRFDTMGNDLDLVEFVVNDSTLAFDQLEPRIAADGDRTFVMVWEDWGNDGSGSGIFARRYDIDGSPLAPEWRVNEVTAGNQRLPEVAVADEGRFIVTWKDESTGVGRILAQLHDPQAQAVGPAFVVSGDRIDGIGYGRPQVALDVSGTLAVFTYDGPGTGGNNTRDVFVRRFEILGEPSLLDDDRRVEGARPTLGPARAGSVPGAMQAAPPPALQP